MRVALWSGVPFEERQVFEANARRLVRRGVDEIAMSFDEPIDTVEGTATFFVCGERHNKIAIWYEVFLLVLN